jgi:hypothetical protein
MMNEKFWKGIEELGYKPEAIAGADNRVAFDYEIEEGTLKGVQRIGFEVPQDFEMSTPSGVHIKTRALTINPNANDHPQRVADSPPFGPEWQYLSRPYYDDWAKSPRTVREYMLFIKHILNTL